MDSLAEYLSECGVAMGEGEFLARLVEPDQSPVSQPP